MAFIIETGDLIHPKAEVALIDFRKGQIDFRWLEADGTPSKIYAGDCVSYKDLSAAKDMMETQTLVTNSIKTEAEVDTAIEDVKAILS